MPNQTKPKTKTAPAPARANWSAGPRLVYVLAKQPLMTRDDIHDAFAKIGPDDDLARALRQIVHERSAAAMSDAAGSGLSAEDRAHAGGRLEELLGFMAELSELTGVRT